MVDCLAVGNGPRLSLSGVVWFWLGWRWLQVIIGALLVPACVAIGRRYDIERRAELLRAD